MYSINKGFKVPKEQADELGKLGVKIQSDNILESKEWTLNEVQDKHLYFLLT